MMNWRSTRIFTAQHCKMIARAEILFKINAFLEVNT